MSSDRQKQLKKNIRRCTKRIGEALKTHDHNEASNLRQQRATFIQSLIDEFEEYFILRDSKSCFVTLDEATAHYKEPENRKNVASARAVSEIYQGRQFLRERYKMFSAMDDAKVKATILDDIDGQIKKMERVINELLEGVEKPTINFDDVDSKKDDDDGFLDGIDMSSLL